MQSVGQKIKSAREFEGLSVQTVAKAVGCSRQAIYTWEKDTHVPTLPHRRKLERLFELPAGSLNENGPA